MWEAQKQREFISEEGQSETGFQHKLTNRDKEKQANNYT